jgi:hypothetical protein
MAAQARTQIGNADGEKLKLVAEQVEQIDFIDLFVNMCRVQDEGNTVAGVGELANPYKIQCGNLLSLEVEEPKIIFHFVRHGEVLFLVIILSRSTH